MTEQAALPGETQTADAMLRARARRVVPGGMWGQLNAARRPEGYPQFFASAEGCRVLVAMTARRRARSADRRLRAAINEGSQQLVVEPVEAELSAYTQAREALSAALA